MAPAPDGAHVLRRLVPAQTLLVLGSSVDLTLTGVVGAQLAPTRALATLPFSLIPLVGAASTFVLSRGIGRYGYRRVLAVAPLAAVLAGLVSALGVQRGDFALFCVGTALVGVYAAAGGYYRYVAAEANPHERARAVSVLLGGGLVAALVGPFLATAVRGLTDHAYVASYLLVALFGAVAAVWNLTLPRVLDEMGRTVRSTAVAADVPRSRAELWRQPTLLLGVAASALAVVAMMSMMSAGPVAGMDMGHSQEQATLAVQLHMVGMYAPGFLVPRWIGRFGERRVAALGAVVLVVAGLAAVVSSGMWAFVTAMTVVGVGWNLASSGGSAMIAGSYRPSERGRVQPWAEAAGTTFQVGGTLAAGAVATASGWTVLGGAVAAVAVVVAFVLGRRLRAVEQAPPPSAPADLDAVA